MNAQSATDRQSTEPQSTAPRSTALHALHVELGGRMVDFAGWELPIQYEGVIAEHTACREQAALFDVSHMGIVELRADGGPTAIAEALEALTPASVATIAEGRQRYALLTNAGGGVIDDCIITNRGDHVMIVVNAARRVEDLAHLRSSLTSVVNSSVVNSSVVNSSVVNSSVEITERDDLSLLALQGPEAANVLGRFCPAVDELVFLDFATVDLELANPAAMRVSGVGVSRSGYTGEDGFELIVANDQAEAVARALLAQPEVSPSGLGARDTLRLEAGLALYGNDLDETTSPVEADLVWTMPKRRREDGRFLGAERILAEHRDGPSRRRVGLRPVGKRPVRDGTALRTTEAVRTTEGVPAGVVTSGGYGPTVEGPVAMGYVATELAEDGQVLVADVRGNDVEVHVAPLPFTPHRYHRGS